MTAEMKDYSRDYTESSTYKMPNFEGEKRERCSIDRLSPQERAEVEKNKNQAKQMIRRFFDLMNNKNRSLDIRKNYCNRFLNWCDDKIRLSVESKTNLWGPSKTLLLRGKQEVAEYLHHFIEKNWEKFSIKPNIWSIDFSSLVKVEHDIEGTHYLPLIKNLTLDIQEEKETLSKEKKELVDLYVRCLSKYNVDFGLEDLPFALSMGFGIDDVVIKGFWNWNLPWNSVEVDRDKTRVEDWKIVYLHFKTIQ